MHPYVKSAAIALAAFAAVAMLQKSFTIPVIGAYLPKASA